MASGLTSHEGELFQSLEAFWPGMLVRIFFKNFLEHLVARNIRERRTYLKNSEKICLRAVFAYI